MLIRKALSLLLLSTLTMTVQADVRDYFVGTFSVDGFDTAVIESYKAKATITVNKGHFLNISIDHDNASGIGTYYGHINEIDKDTLQLEYWNLGRQKHTATCEYWNDGDNFPRFTCNGSLLGNVGSDGVFVIHKR